MRLFLLVLLGLWLGLGPLRAQTASPPPAGTAAELSPEALARLLEDDASRAALIARLRAAGATTGSATPEMPALLAPEPEPTFARQLAEYSRDVAEQAAGLVQHTVSLARGFRQLVGELAEADRAALWSGAATLLLLVAVVLGGFYALRLLAAPLLAGIARRAAGRSPLVRAAILLSALLVEAMTVLLAWGAGYLFALNYGTTGVIAVQQTLLLNAFLVVEGGKALVRAALMPRYPALRLLPLGDEGARAWSFWLSRAASLIGYTFMLLAPLLNSNASVAAAQSLRLVVMLAALLMGIFAVLRHRRAGQRWIAQRQDVRGLRAFGRGWTALGHAWHVLAILYLLALFLAWVANPRHALGFMLSATWQSVAAVVAGAVVLHLTRRLFAGGVHVPETVQERLPLLQRRLNTFIPAILRVVRGLVGVAILLAVAQAWGVLDVLGWLSTEAGHRFVAALVSASLIVLVGMAVYVALSSWVEYRLNPNYGTVPTPRERTLLSLFRNAATVALFILVAMLALSELGVNIGPLLAGAGVIGLAIGFGAQKLVQDIITGAFIQFENAMNEGDVVAAGGVSGVVEKLTIRSLSIRDLNGTLHLVPFSSVDTVSNMMKDFAFHVAEIGVAYRESIPEVKAAMQEAFERLQKTEHGPSIIGPLDMQGVTAFADSAVMVRARIKTVAGKHWGAGRAYNEILKEVFDARGIEIPFPHITLYMGEDKHGNAPPLHLARQPPRPAPAAPVPAPRVIEARVTEAKATGGRAEPPAAGPPAPATAPAAPASSAPASSAPASSAPAPSAPGPAAAPADGGPPDTPPAAAPRPGPSPSGPASSGPEPAAAAGRPTWLRRAMAWRARTRRD